LHWNPVSAIDIGNSKEAIMAKFTPLASAFGHDKAARDIADNINLGWCRLAVQQVLAALSFKNRSYSGPRRNLMSGPFYRAANPFRQVKSGGKGLKLSLE
jgi:hypothetical protein